MSFGESWSYSNSIYWKNKYPDAKGNNQSPINIDKNNINLCDILCEISIKYAKSNCILTVKNRTPIVYFSSGSYIKYRATNDILSLKLMTIHTPSLHSINGVKYDMEVVLYHKLSGGLNNNSQNYVKGGTAISILFQKGSDYGKQNNFFNSFVYKIPNDVDSINKKKDIDVGNKWGPELILPDYKSYFYYEGSLPFPNCEEEWKWIVFEDIQYISSHILEVLKIGFDNNIRPLKKLDNRTVSYHSTITLRMDNELIKKSMKTSIIKDNYNNKKYDNLDKFNDNKDSAMLNDIYNNYIDKNIFKLLITFVLIILIIFASLKLTRYIATNELLNILLLSSIKTNKTK